MMRWLRIYAETVDISCAFVPRLFNYAFLSGSRCGKGQAVFVQKGKELLLSATRVMKTANVQDKPEITVLERK